MSRNNSHWKRLKAEKRRVRLSQAELIRLDRPVRGKWHGHGRQDRVGIYIYRPDLEALRPLTEKDYMEIFRSALGDAKA